MNKASLVTMDTAVAPGGGPVDNQRASGERRV